METYDQIPDFELAKCAMCQREMKIGHEDLIHIALCSECEFLIHSYEPEPVWN